MSLDFINKYTFCVLVNKMHVINIQKHIQSYLFEINFSSSSFPLQEQLFSMLIILIDIPNLLSIPTLSLNIK